MLIEDISSTEPRKVERQSPERATIASSTIFRIGQLKAIRNQTYSLLRDRTMNDYWDDSVKRFVQFKQRPAHKAAWQANTASSTPADKLISILSKLAGQPMEAQVFASNDSSRVGRQAERVLGAALKAAGLKLADAYQLVLEMFAAMSKGTVIGFEGWRFGEQTVRDVTDQDAKTGEVKIKERVIYKWNDVWGEIVSVENFYPGSIFVRPGQIQDMSDCALRKVIKYDKWKLDYGNYIDADKVLPKQQMVASDTSDNPFYKFDVDVEGDEIEHWVYFNQDTDEMIILANGIWINPMSKATVAPMPWSHKRLPFWAAVFEPFAEDFFYGRSLPDKLISMVDMQDALFDRMLDQLALAIHKPIITHKNATSITKGFMHPGAVIQTKGGGDVRTEFTTLDVAPPSQAHVQMLNIIQQRLESSAASAQANSTGQRKTATQVMQEQEAAVEFASLSLKFMEFAAKEKYSLRLANIIQFYTMPVHSKNNEAKFKRIILRNEQLRPDGQVGTLDIEFTDQPMAEAQQQAEQQAKQMGEPMEVIKVSPSFIRNVETYIEIVPATSVKQTESVRKAMEISFQTAMAQLYPDKMNRDSAFEDMIRVWGKDITRLRAVTPAQQQDMNPLDMNKAGGSMGSGGNGTAAGNVMQGLSTSLRQIGQGQ